jgi:hypothetical protein
MINVIIVLISLHGVLSSTSTCTNAFPKGFYTPCYGTGCVNFTAGIPPPTPSYIYTLTPPTLTPCEFNEIERLCVERINMYRNGTLIFSNGSRDPQLGTPVPLQYIPQMDQCHSGKLLK